MSKCHEVRTSPECRHLISQKRCPGRKSGDVCLSVYPGGGGKIPCLAKRLDERCRKRIGLKKCPAKKICLSCFDCYTREIPILDNG